MLFDLLTLFPSFFDSFLNESLIGKALEKGAFEVRVTDIREFATDRHRTADDRPFGGGPGMVLKPEPLCAAVESVLENGPQGTGRVVLTSPSGRPLNQAKVRELAGLDQLVLICGRYEGVDDRVVRVLEAEEISLGDFVLCGGEIPAMALVEAVARLLPGVLGKEESTLEETFSQGLLEYPQFTRPREFRGLAAPEELLSGDHAAVRIWRLKESLRRTLRRRPDLLEQSGLAEEEKKLLAEIRREDDEDLA